MAQSSVRGACGFVLTAYREITQKEDYSLDEGKEIGNDCR
jgi:hypothetical protein